MSALNVQEEVADSGKDDENNVITATTHSNKDNANEDSANVQIDDNRNQNLETAEQTSSANKPTEKVADLSSPLNENEAKTLQETDKSFGDSNLATPLMAANETIQSFGVCESLPVDVKPNESKVPVESRYKETMIDDEFSDADFELRWSDDENDDKVSLPLSDEAIKKLDKELGIDFDEENDKNRDESHNLEATAAEKLKDLEISKKSVDDSPENETNMKNISDDKLSSENVLNIKKELKHTTEEVAGIVLPEITSQKNEIENVLPVSNVGSKNTETTSKNLIDAEKETDVTKEEKVKPSIMIDQDKDTLKQIEQDISKPDNISIEKEEIEEISDTAEENTNSEAIKSDSNIEDLKREDVKPMDKDHPPKLESNVSTISSLHDISTGQKEKNICQSTTVSTLSEEKGNDEIEFSIKVVEKMDTEDQNTSAEVSSDCKKKELNAIKSRELSENDMTVVSNAASIQEKFVEPNLVEEVTSNENTAVDEKKFITPDITDESIKLNTEHRINRPNIMLDIPTQEFDFNEFDEICERQERSDKSLDSKSDLTTKTVTEIVNQMAKADAERMDIDNSEDINSKIKEQQESVTTSPIKLDANSSNAHCAIIEMETEATPCENSNIEILKNDLPTSKSELAVIKNIENSENSPAISATENIVKLKMNEKTTEMDVVTTDNTDKVPEKADKSLQDNVKTTENVDKLENPSQNHETEATRTESLGIDNIVKTNNDNIQSDIKSTEIGKLDFEPSTSVESAETASKNTEVKADLVEKNNLKPIEKETQYASKSDEDKLQSETTKNVKQPEEELTENVKPVVQPQSQEIAAKPDDKVDLTPQAAMTEKENVQPSTSIETTATKTEEIDVKKPETELTDKEKPSTSAEVIKLKDKDDKKSVDSKDKIDVQPSTSTAPDTLEETQQVDDSLGLLAESSMVMDEEEDDEDPEPEEEEPDDADDDDFDPDAEENSNQTEEHSEESNPPLSDIDIKEDIDIEFNEVGRAALDSNDALYESLLMQSYAVIKDEENDLKIAKGEAEESQKKSPSKEVPSTSTEKTGESGVTDKSSTDHARSLLAALLTRPAADMYMPKSKKAVNSSKKEYVVVDLEDSSDEDGKDKQEAAPSIAQKDQQADDMDKDKSVTTDVTEETSESTKTIKEILTESNKDKSMAEILNLDSDDDEKAAEKEVTFIEKPREGNQCINYNCTSDENVSYYLADRLTILFYGAARKRRRPVCQNCLDVVNARNEGLVAGIKDLRPLMSLRMARPAHTLLEISDSDSEGDDEPLGEGGANLLEDQLTDMLNDVWTKYNMDDRLKETEEHLEAELEKMLKQSDEVDRLLRDCQKATDKLRVDFYSSFENPRKEVPSISIHDTPIASYACMESDEISDDTVQCPQFSLRYPKRRSTTSIETPAKKQAIQDERRSTRYDYEPELKQEEDKDISVVRLSAEAAPSELPPVGEPAKPPLRVGASVYAMKNQYGAWLKGKVLEIQHKTHEQQFTTCRIRFEHKVKNPCKMLCARSIAYTEPCEVRMTIGTRVIALFKNSENTNKRGEFYYSGVIAEIPNPVNSYRYLVFFDDGYAQYVEHKHTRLVCESKTLVWEEVHPFSRDFVCNYLMKYPERPMVRLHPAQSVTVEWNGKWWETKVIQVDAALVHVRFPDNRTEWIYRGSTRLQPLFTELQAARRTERARMPRSTKASVKANVPYVEYTRSDDQPKNETQSVEELRRQRSVAKKSTTIAQQITSAATDGVVSRVVYYTPKNSVRPLKMVPHTCAPHCKRSDLLTLNDLRTYNPLTKPLLSGWERQIVRHKSSRTVMYRAPCGRRLRDVGELHSYLRAIRSDMPVDLFDFNPVTHCLAEFVLNKTNVQKKDLSHGKENVPVPCVNYYDHSLPEFCSYNTERTPTSGVPLNLDPDFLCGCDCEDDCVDKSKCACWKMTLEGARTIGIEGHNVGYHYRRLPEPLPSGIYECNSRCKCKSTCLNRVAQNPLQLKLQVFKTLNRGWGIRALNDVPKGTFICIYAGNLLTDATANLDGLNEGDEYLAELDYIEVVESMKEGYEEDVPEADKKLDRKNTKKSESEPETETSESEEEERADKTDTEDGDFRPAYMTLGLTEFNKRLRRRDKKKVKEEGEEKKKDTKESSEDKTENKKDDGEECITISDDEEVRVSQREPSRFAAEELMTDNKVVSKYRSIRTYFGEDEACYIMDAKVQGNIGRYLNHSCSPNVFVQNVFVDTHDPRFPWVSFFALHHIRAGTELTWNYNYDIGSVPGKVLYCYCGAPNCRGRLL